MIKQPTSDYCLLSRHVPSPVLISLVEFRKVPTDILPNTLFILAWRTLSIVNNLLQTARPISWPVARPCQYTKAGFGGRPALVA